MKKNHLTATIISAITILGPLQYSLRPDVIDTPLRGGMMVLTIIGTLAALFIGISGPEKA